MSNMVPFRNDLITQVQQSKFPITKLRNGYSFDDVDDFLDQLIVKLQDDASANELLDLLGAAHFRATKFRLGYLAERVDTFVENLRSDLAEEIKPRQ